jgi:aldehyde dehydrogenase (NAD+)
MKLAAAAVRPVTITRWPRALGFEAPFGGYKASGIGREYATAGLTQFTEHKSVAV